MKSWFSGPDWSAEAKRVDADVHQRLRASVTPPAEPPPWLHASILNAVRQSAAARATPRARLRFAWALPVVLVALGAGWFALQPPTPRVGETATGASPDDALAAVTWQSAAAVVQPLEDELGNLTRDWERTREFLLASLP